MSFRPTSNDSPGATRQALPAPAPTAEQPKPKNSPTGPKMVRPAVERPADQTERVGNTGPWSAPAVKVSLGKALLAETGAQDSSPSPGPTPAQGSKLTDGVLGFVFAPVVYFAYAIALSGRQWKTGSTKPQHGGKDDVLGCIRDNFWAGLNPVCLTVRAGQTVCLPVAGIGKVIDLAVDPFRSANHDRNSTFSGLPRSVFGYTFTAADAAARTCLSPLALLGVGIHRASAAANSALAIGPGVVSGTHFYEHVARTVGVAARTLALPAFALGEIGEVVRFVSTKMGYKAKLRSATSLPSYWRVALNGAIDWVKSPFAAVMLLPSLLSLGVAKAASKITGLPQPRRGFWHHGVRGVRHIGEVTLALPAAPFAGVGKLATVYGPKIAEASGFKADPWNVVRDTDSTRKAYWKNAAVGLAEAAMLPFRVAALPFAYGSLAFDKLIAKPKDGEEIKPRTFWSHTVRGVARTAETCAYVPLAPLAGIGKGMDWLCRKTARAVDFKVRRQMYGDNDSLRKQYWTSVGLGIGEALVLPVRLAALPGAAVSALYEPTCRWFKLERKDLAERKAHGLWFHGFWRGPGLTVVGVPAAVGGVISTLGKSFVPNPDETKTLWGHDRSWTGYAIDAVDSVGRAAGATFYGVDWLVTRQLNGESAAEDKRDFYWRAGRGVLRTAGLPVLVPGAVAGGLFWGVDTYKGRAELRDRSVIGLASDGLTRSFGGFTRVYDAYLRESVDNAVKAVAERAARVSATVSAAYQRTATRVSQAVNRFFKRA